MRVRVWPIVVIIAILIAIALIIIVAWQPAQPPPAPTGVPPTPTLPAPESTSTPTATPTSPPTPAPLVYTVQGGDTLTSIALAYGVTVDELVAANGIADPNVLRIGQTLVIPGRYAPTPTPPPPTGTPQSDFSPTPTAALPSAPRATQLPTLTPAGPPLVEISQISGAGDLAVEIVIVHNRGGLANLGGWQLSDAEGNTFTFPSFVLFGDADVRIHSKVGISTPTDLYWNRTSATWSVGELAILYDAAGNMVDAYITP